MEARIEILEEKKIVGKHVLMSYTENKTFELWSGFMPNRKEIQNAKDSNLYSLEVFPADYFNDFDPSAPFEKWAGVEVTDFENMPLSMEKLHIPKGKYAVFLHKGPATEAHTTYHSIFADWLPKSEYHVDDRPHFAVMGDHYKKDDPNSEEEIWIPIKNKI